MMETGASPNLFLGDQPQALDESGGVPADHGVPGRASLRRVK
jgi:hypothetical protein